MNIETKPYRRDQVGSPDFSLFGQESNGSTWALSKMNLFLHEKDNARIEWGDTIGNPLLTEGNKLMKFDIVVANPPFSLDKWGAENAENDPYQRFWRGIPPKSKGDYAFICHMVESAVEAAGKVGVIVPHGVLFRGNAECRIRKQFIEENVLEAVIGLPANLFFGTGIPAAILIFNKGKKTQDVLFIDASREYLEGKNQNALRSQDIDKIVQAYEQFKTLDKYAYRATFEEIQENDYNLNIPRYVDTFEEDEEVDVSAIKSGIEVINSKLSKTESEIAKYLKELNFW